MRKKWMAAIMAAALAAGTLAGCGNTEKQGGRQLLRWDSV